MLAHATAWLAFLGACGAVLMFWFFASVCATFKGAVNTSSAASAQLKHALASDPSLNNRVRTDPG